MLLKRILVPLDGSELAEGALVYATELAERMGLEVLLARVVLAASLGTVVAAPPNRDEVIGEADRYLAGVEARLLHAGLRAGRIVLYGNAADEIIDAAEENDVDLVVMASHGRSGLGRWVSGSVADRVFRGSRRPVLLVRSAVAGSTEGNRYGAVHRCHNCGRATYQDTFEPLDRCLYCGYYLRSCANCASFDGISCAMQNPQDKEESRPTGCRDFRFVVAGPPAETGYRSSAGVLPGLGSEDTRSRETGDTEASHPPGL